MPSLSRHPGCSPITPRTTIVVVPRESFSATADTIRRIYAVTREPFRMIVAEGGAPDAVRQRLRALASKLPNLEIWWSSRWIRPREAVNGTIPLVGTEYVVYIDNDVEVERGWLEALVRCADEERVACVHPIYLRSLRGGSPIYVAENRLEREPFEGRVRLRWRANYTGVRLADYPDPRRKPSAHFEWNCALFRTAVLKDLWPLEDLSICAYLDDAFRLERLGHAILLEPAAAVAFDDDRYRRLTGLDLDYMLWRWDVTRVRSSLALLCARWNLHPALATKKIDWVAQRRALAGTGTLGARIAKKVWGLWKEAA